MFTELVAHHQLDLQPWIACQQHREPRRQEEPAGDRRAQPDKASWRVALLAESLLHLVGNFHQLPRMNQHFLTVVSQAEAAGGSMEQTGPEMLLQLGNLAGHGGLADPALA
jgi:hypothetical protein